MWSTAEARAVTGATDRQLLHWSRRGYVMPDGAGLGSGFPLGWSFDDLVRVVVLVHAVRSNGSERARLAELVPTLNLDGDFLIVEPRTAVCTAQEVAALSRAHDFTTAIPLAAIRSRITAAVNAL